MTNEYLEIAADSDAEYWTPPLLLGEAWAAAIADAQQLLLRVPVGAVGDGTVTLQAIAEYWIDQTSVLGSPTRNSFAYDSHVKADYVHDGVDSYNLTGLSESLMIHQEDEFAETLSYSELAVLLDHGAAWSESGLADSLLFFADLPAGTVRVRAAMDSATPTLPATTGAYAAMTLTDAYVDIVGTGGGVGTLTADFAAVLAEVQSAVGPIAQILIVITPVGNEPTGGLEATFASIPASVEVGEEIEGAPEAGPQGLVYEGTGGVCDADLGEITAQTSEVTLSDAVDVPRQIVEFAWSWSPGVGVFEFADHMMVRFRLSRLTEYAPVVAGELRIYTPIVTVGEAPAYGYGG